MGLCEGRPVHIGEGLTSQDRWALPIGQPNTQNSEGSRQSESEPSFTQERAYVGMVRWKENIRDNAREFVEQENQQFKFIKQVRKWRKLPGAQEISAPKEFKDTKASVYIMDKFPETRGYEYPPTGYANAKLATDVAMNIADEWYLRKTKTIGIRAIIETQKLFKHKLTLTDDPDNFSDEFIKRRFLQTLNKETSKMNDKGMSGWPAAYIYSTKAKQKEDAANTFAQYAAMVLQMRNICDQPVLPNFIDQEFDENHLFMAPHLIIQKVEAHKQSKVVQGRFRTLQVADLHSYILADLLFNRQTDYMEHWHQTPVIAGCSTDTKENREQLKHYIRDWNSPITSSDVSGYEYSTDHMCWLAWVCSKAMSLNLITETDLVPLIGEDEEKKLHDYLSSHKSLWVKMTMLYMYKCGSPNILFEDGSEYQLLRSDGTKARYRNPSGHKMTGDFGSISRVMREMQISLDFDNKVIKAYAMGDDIASTISAGALEQATFYGMKLTDIKTHPHEYTFIGWNFNNNGEDKFDHTNKVLVQFAYSKQQYDNWLGLRSILGEDFIKTIPDNPFERDRLNNQLSRFELEFVASLCNNETIREFDGGS